MKLLDGERKDGAKTALTLLDFPLGILSNGSAKSLKPYIH